MTYFNMQIFSRLKFGVKVKNSEDHYISWRKKGQGSAGQESERMMLNMKHRKKREIDEHLSIKSNNIAVIKISQGLCGFKNYKPNENSD